MAASELFPFAVWLSGTNQNSIPANDNSLRVEVLCAQAISVLSAQPGSPAEDDQYILGAAPTGAQWAAFALDDVVIFRGGTWYAFAPYDGWLKFNAADGNTYQFTTGGGWAVFTGGGSTAWGDLTGVPANLTQIGALADPGADRLLFWDDSGGAYAHLTLGTNLSITGTTLNATGGGGGGTIGKHAIPVMAGAMRPSVTGGCAALAGIASAAGQPDIVTLDFDPTSIEYAQFSIPMPSSWNEGTVTFKPIWSHTTATGAVVWDLQAVAISDDDTILANYGSSQSSVDTGGTANDVYVGPESSPITIAGTPAAGDMVFFRFSRNANAVGDTLTVDARLHGIVLYVTTDAEVDS